MKFVIFDAGPLISLTLSGELDILEKIKTRDVEFMITPQVKKEVIENAMSIRKYKLEAIQISSLIERGVLKNTAPFVKDVELAKETARIISLSREIISTEHEKITLIQEGEASCLAFSKLCNQENIIVVDERTTRLITESIENLKKMMENKLQVKISVNKKQQSYFQDFKYIRSTELIFLAFKKGLINLKKDKETLDALLYNLKFHGTAISSREIEEMKRIS